MGTDYVLLRKGDVSLELWEMSSRFTLALGYADPTAAEELFAMRETITPQDVLEMALEAVKVARWWVPEEDVEKVTEDFIKKVKELR